MNDPETPIVERLLGTSHRLGTLEEKAATLLRSAANRRPPGPVALARVQDRLVFDIAPSIATRARWKAIVALVALSVGVGGVTAAAVWVAMPQLSHQRSDSPGPGALQESRSRSHKGRRVAPRGEAIPTAGPTTGPLPEDSPAGVAEAAPAEEPTRITAAPIHAAVPPFPSPHGGAGRRAAQASPQIELVPLPPAMATRTVAMADPGDSPTLPPASSLTAGALSPPAWRVRPPPSPSPAIAQEAHLLGLALQSLRRDHDPRAALIALNEHAVRFPASALALEADVTRVDALLALDHRPAALVVLDRLRIPDTARGRELTVLRAELRAGAKRCAEAIADFTQLLAATPSDDFVERALYGRAACRLALGNQALARADLQDYVTRFPTGRFADAVRRTARALESASP